MDSIYRLLLYNNKIKFKWIFFKNEEEEYRIKNADFLTVLKEKSEKKLIQSRFC